METAPAERSRALRALLFFERTALPGMLLDLHADQPVPKPVLPVAAPYVAPRKNGSKACGCGRTISANKASCRPCRRVFVVDELGNVQIA